MREKTRGRENYLLPLITHFEYSSFTFDTIPFFFCSFAGKDVVGEYTIKEPGGNIRTVKYRAGKNGFFAHVFNSNGNDHDGGHHH